MKLLLLYLLLCSGSNYSRSSATHFSVSCYSWSDNVILTAPELSEGEYVQIGIRAGGKLLPTFMFPCNNRFYVWTEARRGTFDAKIRVGDDYRTVRCPWSRLKPFRRL